MLGDCGEGRLRRRSGGRAARDHAGAVVKRQGAGAVEAGLVDPSEEVDGVGLAVGAAVELAVGAVPQLGEDPGRGREVVLVVLDGAAGDFDPEAGEQVVEVVSILRLLGLPERDQAAAAAHELLNRIELAVGEARGAGVGGRFPPGIGGVGDDEDVGAGEGLSGERALGVRRNVEVAVGERLGGERVRGVPGVRRLHLLGELAADRPRLGVGLVEEDAGHLRLLGHVPTVGAGDVAVNGDLWTNRAIIQRMDVLDRKILSLLVEDGRRTYDDIAQRVSLSAPSVKRRIDRLRERGALEGFTAVVDHGAMGWNTEALVELFYRPGTTLDEVAKTLRAHPEVVEGWSVTGEADAIARVRTEDNASLERLIMELQRNGLVVRTRSQVVLSRLVGRASEGL
jgi:DNA-binding Lrp family transcriptional regulator